MVSVFIRPPAVSSGYSITRSRRARSCWSMELRTSQVMRSGNCCRISATSSSSSPSMSSATLATSISLRKSIRTSSLSSLRTSPSLSSSSNFQRIWRTFGGEDCRRCAASGVGNAFSIRLTSTKVPLSRARVSLSMVVWEDSSIWLTVLSRKNTVPGCCPVGGNYRVKQCLQQRD